MRTSKWVFQFFFSVFLILACWQSLPVWRRFRATVSDAAGIVLILGIAETQMRNPSRTLSVIRDWVLYRRFPAVARRGLPVAISPAVAIGLRAQAATKHAVKRREGR